MRILLVEDDVKIASFIIKGLRAAGYAVDHAPDGEEGLRLALTEPYDAAVIDLMLPRKDGLCLIRELRAKKVKAFYVLVIKPVFYHEIKGAAHHGIKKSPDWAKNPSRRAKPRLIQASVPSWNRWKSRD